MKRSSISAILYKRERDDFGNKNRQEGAQCLNFQTALSSYLIFSSVYLWYETQNSDHTPSVLSTTLQKSHTFSGQGTPACMAEVQHNFDREDRSER